MPITAAPFALLQVDNALSIAFYALDVLIKATRLVQVDVYAGVISRFRLLLLGANWVLQEDLFVSNYSSLHLVVS